MDFYDKFLSLCSKRGITPSKAVLDIGLSKPAVTRWKNGGHPTDASLLRIATYFNVPIEYFSDKWDKEKPATVSGDELVFTDQEKAFILWLRSLPAEKKQAVLNFQDMF